MENLLTPDRLLLGSRVALGTAVTVCVFLVATRSGLGNATHSISEYDFIAALLAGSSVLGGIACTMANPHWLVTNLLVGILTPIVLCCLAGGVGAFLFFVLCTSLSGVFVGCMCWWLMMVTAKAMWNAFTITLWGEV